MEETNRPARGRAPNGPNGSDWTDQPHGLFDRVRERAQASIETQKDRALDGLGSVAHAVRDSSQHLRSEQHDTIARYIEQAADEIERIAQRLRQKEVREFVNDIQAFARRQPAVFIGSAFALGVLGARFLKSSSEPRSDRFDRAARQPDFSTAPTPTLPRTTDTRGESYPNFDRNPGPGTSTR